jgi:RNA polymerase sigma factor (sigma-70 family)
VQDKEDAFQATFLALARDAGSVRTRASIAAWLHGVARHIALDVRRAAARRHKYEEQAMTRAVKNPAWQAAWREVQGVLDEEIQRLPAKYREPFVLCCLENQGRAEVAARLGLKEGTVGSRLTEARRRLRERLARRGVELPAVLATSALASGAANAHVPAALAATVTRTAAQMASGHALKSGLVSARILSLVQGVPKVMFLTKATIGTLLLLAVGVVGAVAYQPVPPGAVEAPHGAQAPRRKAEPPVLARAGAADKPEAPVAQSDKIMWKEEAIIETPGWLPVSVAYSSNGKMLVVGGTGGKVVAFDSATRKENWKAEVGGNFSSVAFTADSKSILATFPDGVRFLDAVTGKLGDALEEKDSRPIAVGVFPDKDFFAGGNQKFTSRKVIFANAQRSVVKTWIASGAPGTIEALIAPKDKNPVDPNAVPLAVDPEGRSAIVTGPIDRDTGKNVLWAWVAGDNEPGSPGNRLLKGHEAVVVSAAWSRDGKTAVTGDASGRVIVWDAKTMKESHRLEVGGRVAAVAVSPESKHLAAVAVGQRAEFYVWDTAKPKHGKPIHVDSFDFSGPIHACLAFSPDGQQLAGCAINTAWLARLGELVGKLHVWNAEKARP